MSEPSLRITHVVNTDVFAGLERYVVDVSTELAERGHRVTVIGGAVTEMRAALPAAVTWHPGAGTRAALGALIQGGRRDIVHSHIAKSDFVGLLATPATRGRRVSTRHITAPRGYTRAARRMAPLVRAGLAAEIAVSAWTSAQLERRSDVVLLNGVGAVPDVTAPRVRIVLVAQRLEAEKDTDTALRAWARSGLAARGWRLQVAGRGSLRDALGTRAAALGVADSVEFLGWVADPAQLYRSAAMFLAPAPTEPCGLSVLEAMAHGLPVVAAAAAGHAETVATVPGAALFGPGDDVAAAAALVRLADDPAGRERYGETLRTVQRESFSITAHVDALERIYRRVLNR